MRIKTEGFIEREDERNLFPTVEPEMRIKYLMLRRETNDAIEARRANTNVDDLARSVIDGLKDTSGRQRGTQEKFYKIPPAVAAIADAADALESEGLPYRKGKSAGMKRSGQLIAAQIKLSEAATAKRIESAAAAAPPVPTAEMWSNPPSEAEARRAWKKYQLNACSQEDLRVLHHPALTLSETADGRLRVRIRPFNPS